MNEKQTQTGGCQGKGDKGGKEWEFGISKSKLSCAVWINKVLPRAGNYIQTSCDKP